MSKVVKSLLLTIAKGVSINTAASLAENVIKDTKTGDGYVSLVLEDGARNIKPETVCAYPSINVADLESIVSKANTIRGLHFTPYYFRGNRGGKGHMRVGLRRL